MKKKQATNTSFGRFILDSMDDNVKRVNESAFLLPAAIAIVAWIVFASTGLQEAFTSITDLQQMMDVWENGGKALDDYLSTNTQADSSWWDGFTSVFSSEEQPQPQMSPFKRGLIVNSSTMAALIIFLTIMTMRFGKGNWKSAVVTTGVATIPMIIGMFISYMLFRIATNSQSENLPGILYSLGSVIIMTAMMTAFIMIYVNVNSTLGIGRRKRYYTTISAIFVVLAVFGGLTYYLS